MLVLIKINYINSFHLYCSTNANEMQEEGEKAMNITEYIKSLLYEYRLNKMKAILMEMKYKKYLVGRKIRNGNT